MPRRESPVWSPSSRRKTCRTRYRDSDQRLRIVRFSRTVRRGSSGNLSRRAELRADLASLEARSAELYLVELKAAAIDVVAETAAERDVPVVLCDNEVRTVDGESLDERVLELAEALEGARA